MFHWKGVGVGHAFSRVRQKQIELVQGREHVCLESISLVSRILGCCCISIHYSVNFLSDRRQYGQQLRNGSARETLDHRE